MAVYVMGQVAGEQVFVQTSIIKKRRIFKISKILCRDCLKSGPHGCSFLQFLLVGRSFLPSVLSTVTEKYTLLGQLTWTVQINDFLKCIHSISWVTVDQHLVMPFCCIDPVPLAGIHARP